MSVQTNYVTLVLNNNTHDEFIVINFLLKL